MGGVQAVEDKTIFAESRWCWQQGTAGGGCSPCTQGALVGWEGGDRHETHSTHNKVLMTGEHRDGDETMKPEPALSTSGGD